MWKPREIDEVICFQITVRQRLRMSTIVSRHRIFAKDRDDFEKRLTNFTNRLEKDIETGIIKWYEIIGVCPSPIHDNEYID